MNITDILNWRYAAKRMNGTKISHDKIDRILEAIRLTPTSFGLQAFKVVVIENPEIRERIFTEACPQPQVKEASHLLVFTANKKVTPSLVEEYIQSVANARGMQVSELEGFKAMFNGIVTAGEDQNFEWTSRQTYIALGIGITAAAAEQVDATPIEGFNPRKLDLLLDLPEQNLGSVCLLALGYRDEQTDYLAKAPKVRKAKHELFKTL